MTEQNGKPMDPEELAEAELAEVTGGKGRWDRRLEDSWRDRYERNGDRRGPSLTFEQYLADAMARRANGADMLEARSWWISFDSPADKAYVVYDDGSFEAILL